MVRGVRPGIRLVVIVGLAAAALQACAPGALPEAPNCRLFPADSYWHADVSSLPLDGNSATYVSSAGTGSPLHPDFGTVYQGAPNGIPYNVVPGNQARVNMSFTYASESDPGPYPFPPNARIEGGANGSGDRHVLVVDRDHCRLYETFSSYPQPDGSWQAGSGATWDLNVDTLRPDTWTSADAAGLPILPGLVRYDEVAAGHIDHAIRVTLNQTDRRYVWPARHQAGVSNSNLAPMGERFRLKASVDISQFSAANQVILRALQKYGMIVADNGSSWFISGAPDPRWNDGDLHNLARLTGSSFEAVDTSALMIDPNSGASHNT
jgi:hypothetical protein